VRCANSSSEPNSAWVVGNLECSTSGSAQSDNSPQLLNGYEAYFGTYTIDETNRTVTHHLEGALAAADVGRNLMRQFQVSGEKLTIVVRTTKVSVMVLSEAVDNKAVSEETHTVTANAHGAMILPGLRGTIGQLLNLRNARTGEEIACRVVYVSPHQSEKRQVGVDVMKPCPRFWRITFPPRDLTTQSPEAKGSTSQPNSARTNSKRKK
jgi:hypothetical protein